MCWQTKNIQSFPWKPLICGSNRTLRLSEMMNGPSQDSDEEFSVPLPFAELLENHHPVSLKLLQSLPRAVVNICFHVYYSKHELLMASISLGVNPLRSDSTVNMISIQLSTDSRNVAMGTLGVARAF